jgi:hypothetical protein
MSEVDRQVQNLDEVNVDWVSIPETQKFRDPATQLIQRAAVGVCPPDITAAPGEGSSEVQAGSNKDSLV